MFILAWNGCAYALKRINVSSGSNLWLNAPVKTPVAKIKRLTRMRPTLAMVLGSGFQPVAEKVRGSAEIPYASLPGFPPVTVDGHGGKLIVGHLGDTPVVILSGRAHYYEGYSMARVTFPVRVLAACGVRDVLLTNAAGGINPRFHAGDFMRVTDHINFMGANPLRGAPPPDCECFVDLTDTYAPALGKLLVRAAQSARMKLHHGVYVAVSGPTYETPAEIRAFARLGADAVGMSTVPEAIAARQCGLNVAALSCITNPAAGLHPGKLSHFEVLEQSRRVSSQAVKLLETFAKLYGQTR